MSLHSTPLWQQTSDSPAYPTLAKDLVCDLAIVGAGIAGLTTAYVAAKAGLSVVVLEADAVGAGETGRTSAHLSNALDNRYYFLEEHHGVEGARLAAESHTAAIVWIEKICREEEITCEFIRLPGYLFTPKDGDPAELEKEYDAARRAGLNVTWAPRAPWDSYDTGRALMFPDQAQFHPLRYLYGLAARAVRHGVRIYTQTAVSDVTGGAFAHLKTRNGHAVNARFAVVATNVPFNEWVAIHTKQAAYRSYVMVAQVPIKTAAPALYWDTAEPYHYVRLEKSSDPRMDLLILGGEDHKTGQEEHPEKAYDRLHAWARERFPEMTQVVQQWSGQIVEPQDGLAYIGRSPGDEPNIFLVTGDSGNGLTHGTIAGLLLTDLIQGTPNPWANLYDPARKPIKSAGTFLKENLNVLPHYLDWLSPGSVKAVNEIAKGEGAVIREGLKKFAVYRKRDGGVCTVSAVCPHLGCLVKWNSSEKTWDCPCHGSRFEPEGKVLNGPANSPLEPVAPEKVW